MKKDRIWMRKYIGMAIMLCLAMTMNTACGRKYEPIVLNQESRGTEKESSGEQENLEKRIQVETKEAADVSGGSSSQKNGSADQEEFTESTGTSNQDDSEPADMEESEEPAAEDGTLEDAFYQQSGMLREEAETYRIGIIEDVMSENKEAVAARFVYPRTVTVSSGTFEVKNAEEFLACYDEIFSETFKQSLDAEAEEELFCNNGMISFGTGLIWFGMVSGKDSAVITAVNGTDGCSVRAGGTAGVMQE